MIFYFQRGHGIVHLGHFEEGTPPELISDPTHIGYSMDIPTANNIKDARQSRGLTQAEVTESAGVSQPLLSRIENEDVDPRLSTLYAIVSTINDYESEIRSEKLGTVLPEAIRRRRSDRGLTQRQVAEKSNLSQPMIARIEAGDVDPRASTFQSILNVLSDESNDVSAESDSNGKEAHLTNERVAVTDLEDSVSNGILNEIETAFDSL